MISEIVVKIGKKGEIYFPVNFRKALGLKPGDKVRIKVEKDKIILEKEKDISDILGDYVFEVSIEEIERISEDAQREAGILD